MKEGTEGEGTFLRVSDLSMFRFEVFGEQTVDLEQSFASEANFAVFNSQITGGFLVTKGVFEFIKDVDTEFSLEGVSRYVAFLQLKNDFANECLMRRWPQRPVDGKFARFNDRLVVFDLIEILIMDALQMAE